MNNKEQYTKSPKTNYKRGRLRIRLRMGGFTHSGMGEMLKVSQCNLMWCSPVSSYSPNNGEHLKRDLYANQGSKAGTSPGRPGEGSCPQRRPRPSIVAACGSHGCTHVLALASAHMPNQESVVAGTPCSYGLLEAARPASAAHCLMICLL